MQDLRGGIEKVAQFLGKSLSENQLEKLVQHLTFENLSKNSAVNKEEGKTSGSFHEDGNFMRKGTEEKKFNLRLNFNLLELNHLIILFCYCFYFFFLSGNSKGETGDWEKHFSPQLSRKIDDWTESNLRGSDITFVDKI